MSLKKFESLELIAKGGMAEVYRARTVGPEGFAKDVCVKKILPHLTADEQFVSMFINEAKLAATLSYANIVQVQDLCVSSDSEYFIVMEYVHGKDLSDIIRAAQLAGREISPTLAVYVAREVAKGLYYAHTKVDSDGAPLGIIHRDISPQNVLCSFMGEVKLTDFGIAKASSIMNKTAVGILKGKYGYMSPEQARGEPLDARSDIFCLGIVLYEMLVGERCFAGASDYSTLNLMREAVVTPPTQINKSIPKDLEAIVLKTLAKDKSARWQDALELEGALANFAQKSGGEGRSTDLARFVKELFSGPEAKKAGSTGVLALSSIAAPPAAPGAKKQKVAPREKTQDLGALGPTADAPVVPPADTADKPERQRVSNPSEADKRADRPKKKKVEAAEPPAAKEAEPAAEAPPRERKVARVKGGDDADPAAKLSNKDKKAAAAADKRPIARRDLKPGLSKLVRLERRGAGGWLRAALVILAVGGVGAALGYRESRSVSEDSTLRALERVGVEAAADDAVTVLITSEPPGATVTFDGQKLASPTPLSIERPRDGAEHQLELSMAGFPTLKRSFKLADGALTVLEEKMPGAPEAKAPRAKSAIGSTAAIVSTDPPSRMVLDGKDTGRRADGTPLPVDPGTRHRLTLIDEERGVERDLWIELDEGERRTFVIEL